MSPGSTVVEKGTEFGVNRLDFETIILFEHPMWK